MADITLTSAVRNNLTALQNISRLVDQTTERLATGKKVNSALDNPISFFTAQGLNNRAADLEALQDDIGQGVSTLNAADKGIEAIGELIEAGKAKARQALQAESSEDRAKFAAEFNEIRVQIQDIAKDSGYKGKNLLAGDGNSLDIKFNEDGSSSSTVNAVDYTDLSAGDLRIDELTEAVSGSTTIDFGTGTDADTTLASLSDFTENGTITFGSATLDITTDTTIGDFKQFVEENSGLTGSFSGTELTLSGTEDASFSYATTTSGGSPETGDLIANAEITGTVAGSWDTDAGIEASLTGLREAQTNLRAQASTFGTNLTVVENRQDFTTNLIKTLTSGAGKLTLADTDLEGANLAALQTQQQIGSGSLTIAAQAGQRVLQLIR